MMERDVAGTAAALEEDDDSGESSPLQRQPPEDFRTVDGVPLYQLLSTNAVPLSVAFSTNTVPTT